MRSNVKAGLVHILATSILCFLRTGSDAVFHMSRIEFNELSSREVRRLNQFETTDIIRIGLAVLHAWLSLNNGCGPALIRTPIFT